MDYVQIGHVMHVADHLNSNQMFRFSYLVEYQLFTTKWRDVIDTGLHKFPTDEPQNDTTN